MKDLADKVAFSVPEFAHLREHFQDEESFIFAVIAALQAGRNNALAERNAEMNLSTVLMQKITRLEAAK